MPKVNRVGVEKGLGARDFRLIAQGGFGDGLNAYAHSMAWFKEHLYVATMRANFPLMKRRLPIGMDPWPVECPENPFSLDLRAEVWRYAPLLNQWERVHKSPLIQAADGEMIPRELGCRGMRVTTSEGGEDEVLFVSTWSPARGPGPNILATRDGVKLSTTCEPGRGGLPVTTIRNLTAFRGRLYTTPAGSRGGNPNVSSHSVIYESRDGEEGHWEPVCDFGFGDEGNKTIFEMVVCGDYLYAGTFNLEGFQIWRSTMEGDPPYSFEKVMERGGGRGPQNQIALSLYPFQGDLYVGTGIQGGGIDRQNKVGPAPPELIRIRPDKSWDLIVGNPRPTADGFKEPLSAFMPGFDNFFNGYFWRMCEHEGWLYLGTFDWSIALLYARRSTWPQVFADLVNELGLEFILENHAGCDLYRSRDGENWMPVTTSGFQNPYNMGLRTLVSTPYGLFAGTANPFGPKVWPLGGDRYVPNPRGGCEVFLGNLKADEHSR